jgi:hypothetical protein
MNKSLFLTLEEAFARAAEADANLSKEGFLEELRRYVGDGKVRASGLEIPGALLGLPKFVVGDGCHALMAAPSRRTALNFRR